MVPPGCDVIYFTVIWADISARTNGELDKDPVYDKWSRVDKASKNLKLGIQRSNPGASDGGVVSMHANIEVRAELSPPLERRDFDQKITTNLKNPPCPSDTSGSTTADFGFSFRRIATGRWYLWDALAQSYDDKKDDSCPEFEDSDPDRDPAEVAAAPSKATRRAVPTLIVDYDGPGFNGWRAAPSGDVYVVSGKHLDGFDSNRDNMKEYVVFFNFKDKAERCSRRPVWGDTFDSGLSYEDSRVSVLYPPNKGAAGNKVVVGEQVDLSLNRPRPHIESADADMVDRRYIRKGRPTTLFVVGTDLVGFYAMKCGQSGKISLGDHTRVKETDPGTHFSNATEAKVDFKIDEPIGTECEFYIYHKDGESNHIGGFTTVP